MNKEQFKKMRHNARVCRKSSSFTYYDEEEPIPESLQPFLLPPLRRMHPIPVNAVLMGVKGDVKGNREWIRARIRYNYSGTWEDPDQ